MKVKIFLALSLVITAFGCGKDNDDVPQKGLCGEKVVISPSLYQETSSDYVRIDKASLVGNCLTLKIVSGGCNGKTWKAQLIDSGSLDKSNPAQRKLKVLLENEEFCLAIVTREFTFDISKLKKSYSGQMLLSIEKYEGTISF